MASISPEAVELVRSIIPETFDQHLWTAIRDDTGHPSATLLLAEIVVRLDRMEQQLADSESNVDPEDELGLPR